MLQKKSGTVGYEIRNRIKKEQDGGLFSWITNRSGTNTVKETAEGKLSEEEK